MPPASPAWVAELPDELRAAALANEGERVAQGLTPHVDDPVVLDRCARILTTTAVVADVDEVAS